MSTWDAVDGILKSYLTKINTERSLNTTTKGLLHSVMILHKSQREMVSQEIFSCIIFVRFMQQRIP